MRTFSAAPCTAVYAQNAATPASLTLFGLPFDATTSIRSKHASESSQTLNGIRVAVLLASSTALDLTAACSSDLSGRRLAAMTALNANVSASMAWSNRALSSCPLIPDASTSSQTSSYSNLPWVRFPTIAAREAANDPTSAATEPPPGAGDSDASSSLKPIRVIFARGAVSPS
ncbi:hypothetical protein BMS3Bbin04_01501 [bacterium BMS3Bbin04]|nr:hypothetical protein BMS3Bbin04_01501 [bacterium BMS3Bbin04]